LTRFGLCVTLHGSNSMKHLSNEGESRTVNVLTLSMRIAILALALLGTVACGKSDKSRSMGTLDANSSGIDGSVPAGAERIYTLRGITAGYEYTLRTTVTDTNLSMKIFKSEAAYKNGDTDISTASTVTVSVESYPTTTYYEAHFTPDTSGEYVVILGALKGAVNKDEFFYDLRLMSPSVLTAISLPTTESSISPGQLKIFSGGTISAGTYTYSISLKSGTGITANCPQLFVYRDSSLSLQNSLLHSVVTDTTGNFVIFDYLPNGVKRPGYVNEILSSGATITMMLFSAVTPTGPYIVIKGIGAGNSYSLTLQ